MCWRFWRPYIKCGRVLACQRCCHKLKGFRTRKWRKGHDENKLCIRKTNFFCAYMQYASHAPRTTHNSIIFKSFQEEVLPNSISCTWRHIRLVVWSRIFQTHTHTHTTHTTHTHTKFIRFMLVDLLPTQYTIPLNETTPLSFHHHYDHTKMEIFQRKWLSEFLACFFFSSFVAVLGSNWTNFWTFKRKKNVD